MNPQVSRVHCRWDEKLETGAEKAKTADPAVKDSLTRNRRSHISARMDPSRMIFMLYSTVHWSFGSTSTRLKWAPLWSLHCRKRQYSLGVAVDCVWFPSREPSPIP